MFKSLDKEPSDGSEYKDSVKNMFPSKYSKKAMKDTGDASDLKAELQKKVKEWVTSFGITAS
ncbi:hypothetical protein [Bacillus sp. B4EP4a]|uniref:hypothetical protein n=1 Tax=Bacillus sp. B4EP4a TaxID=2590665 RepID=UPI00114F01A7|nr:hypothetical protein [Bacillus sp. B4EP4a]